MTFSAWVPFLPPSLNAMYETAWFAGKARGVHLSKTANRFKLRAMKALQCDGATALSNLSEDKMYELTIAVFFERVQNASWPKAKYKYKRVDITNMVKLVEDVLADAIGVDDRHNFRIIVEKHEDPNNTGIFLSLREIHDGVGLTKEAYLDRLRQAEPLRTDNAGKKERFRRGALRRAPRRRYQGSRG